MPRRRRALSLLLTVLVAGLLVAVHGGTAGAWTRTTVRLSGANRYATASAISQAMYPSGAPAVVIASGETFPDALVGGPLAARVGGPVLLTQRDALPGETATELSRLHPSSVYVIGGTTVISDAVVGQIASSLAGVTPQRLFGPDRYATAAAVSSTFTTTGGPTFVASGEAFPDALAGGAAAAAAGVPLLLTRPEALPGATASELKRLAPASGAVLGGPGAVSDAAFAQIAGSVAALRRLAGPDRFFTAAAIAADQAPTAAEAVLATGLAYPDALAAAPLAAKLRAPLLLTTPACSPPATLQRLSDAHWPDMTVVGGTSAVSRAASLAAPCVPPGDGEIAPGLTLQTSVAAVASGTAKLRVLTVDRSQVDVVAATPYGRYSGRATTSETARRTGALAAVNGDFFTGDGVPVHALASAGRLLKSPGLVEAGAAFDSRSTTGALFGRPSPTVSLKFENLQRTVAIGRVNGVAPNQSETVLYTSEAPTVITPVAPVCAVPLTPSGAPTIDGLGATTQSMVAGTMTCGVTPITVSTTDVLVSPADFTGTPSFGIVPPGEAATLSWTMQGAWGGVRDAIGSNLVIVRGGARSSEAGRTGATFYTQRAARTGVGVLADGRLIVVTVDGGGGKTTMGMLVREFADELVRLGAVDAVNLDGGGSTTMSIRGVLANRPSDAAGERPVGPALVILPKGGTLPPPVSTTTTTALATTTTTAPPATASSVHVAAVPEMPPGRMLMVDPMTDVGSTGGWFAARSVSR